MPTRTELLDVVASPRVLTTGVTPSIIMQQNVNRVGFFIVNFSAAEVIISPLPDVTVTTGIAIPANSGTIFRSASEDIALPKLRWYAVSSLASAQLLLVEQISRDAITPGEAS